MVHLGNPLPFRSKTDCVMTQCVSLTAGVDFVLDFDVNVYYEEYANQFDISVSGFFLRACVAFMCVHNDYTCFSFVMNL